MRKFLLALVMLAAASSAVAQVSRFMVVAGGGGTNGGEKSDRMSAFGLDPMAMTGFNYTFTYHVYKGISLGVKSGLNAAWLRPTFTGDLTDIFENTDYEGNKLRYTTVANGVKYQQNAVTFDIPLMLAVQTNCFYFNVGAKFIIPVWNRYTQTIGEANIYAYSPTLDKTFTNDPTTGVISEEQMNISGHENVHPLYISFGIEFGWAFEIKDHHHIGVEIFADALMDGVGGNVTNNHTVVEVSPISQQGVNPDVTVNTLPSCYYYQFQYPKLGVKLTYCFDMEHIIKTKKTEE